ncbi:MAG: VOC family protein [Gammaproteobacteria bacterium]
MAEPQLGRILHVSVIVSDTARSLDFYQGVLGLAIDYSRPDLGYPGAWLKLGEQQLHLLQLSNPDPVTGRPAHGGRDRHVAIAVNDFAGLRRHFDELGLAYTLSKSGRPAMFIRDPDGNALELIGQA